MSSSTSKARRIPPRGLAPLLAAELLILVSWLPRAEAAESGGALPVLTNAAQITRLTVDEATRSYPVRLRGVLTYVDPSWQLWFVQDASGGVYLYNRAQEQALRAGQEVEVSGSAARGLYGPMVSPEEIKVLGVGQWPEPKRVSSEQLASGEYDGQWVEMEEFLRSIGVVNGHLSVRLGRQLKFSMFVALTNGQTTPMHLAESEVRVRGVAGSVYNDVGRRTGGRLYVPGLEHVTVLLPPPGDPFEQASVRLEALRRPTNGLSRDRRVRVEGTVTHQQANGSFFLQDDSGAAYLKTRHRTPLSPGDRVAAAGYPAMSGTGANVEEAEVRRMGGGALPAPRREEPDMAALGQCDGELIQVEGRLMESLTLTNRAALLLRRGKVFFEAFVEGTNATPALAQWPNGSTLAVTGICRSRSEESRERRSFQVLMSGAGAVALVQGPPWWTTGRVAAALGVVALIFLARLGVALRREAVLRAEHRQLFAQSSDIIYTHDLDGYVTSLNPAGERLMGRPRDKTARVNVREMLPPEKRERWREMMDQITRGELHAPLEIQIITRTGVRKLFETTARVVRRKGRPVGIEGIARDVTERREAEEALRASREQLRSLAARLQSVREEERARIAREVHDELGQSLTGLKMDIAGIASRLPAGEKTLLERARTMSSQIDASIQTVRKIATDLRPGILDNLGLVAALEWQAEEFQARTGIACDCTARVDDANLPPEHCTAIFRIFQETLTNVARHARATSVQVMFSESHGQVLLEVKDNGCGIEEERINWQQSLGLLGMKERAYALGGEAVISGAPGLGTTVTVRVPLTRQAPASA